MKITNTMLKQAKACEEQGNLFKELFPEGVTLTEELCVKHCMDFDWNWAANNLLPRALYTEYWTQKETLWAEYERQVAPLLAEYMRQEEPLYAEYYRQEKSLWAEYKKQQETLMAEYKRQCAVLFYRLAAL